MEVINEIKYMTRTPKQDFGAFSRCDISNTWIDPYKSLFFNQNKRQIFVYIEEGKYKLYFNKLYFPNRFDGGASDGRQVYQVLLGEGNCGSASANFFFKLITYYLVKDSGVEDIEKIFDEKFDSQFIADNYENGADEAVFSKLSEIDQILGTRLVSNEAYSFDATCSNKIISGRIEDLKSKFLDCLSLLKDPNGSTKPVHIVLTDKPIRMTSVEKSPFYKTINETDACLLASTDESTETFELDLYASPKNEREQVDSPKDNEEPKNSIQSKQDVQKALESIKANNTTNTQPPPPSGSGKGSQGGGGTAWVDEKRLLIMLMIVVILVLLLLVILMNGSKD